MQAALPIVSVTTPPSLPPADAATTANNVTSSIGKFTADATTAGTKAKTATTSATTTSAQVEDETVISSSTPPRLILDVTQPGAVQSWCVQHKTWAAAGNVLQAHYNDVGVVVYQAFDREIASWAVKHQRFGGIWSPTRMTWCEC